MFCAYLIDTGKQSSTVKSYMSAIKAVLRDDGYTWNQDIVELSALTRACRLVNDHGMCRFAIKIGLLEILLFEVQHAYHQQPYLEAMYLAIFSVAYYGLMRIGELVQGSHTVCAKNIHLARNKNKMMIMLYHSKTHGKANKPQEIKVEAMNQNQNFFKHRFFCPFKLMGDFLALRGGFVAGFKPLFIYTDRTVVTQPKIRLVLKSLLSKLDLNPDYYGFHSFRAGRASDMLNLMHMSIEEIKAAGRWKSSTVYRYLK